MPGVSRRKIVSHQNSVVKILWENIRIPSAINQVLEEYHLFLNYKNHTLATLYQ
jgi:hypothetical protein